MQSQAHRKKRKSSGEGEDPFWISYSDLMTALMVLFLVSMAVSLIAVTEEISEAEEKAQARQNNIDTCIKNIDALIQKSEYTDVQKRGEYSYSFGTILLFAEDSHRLQKQSNANFLREITPRVLEITRQPECKKWLKRVNLEGFASHTAQSSYLYNLQLSYLRSQRVLCELLNTRAKNALSESDRRLIQKLFFAGGASFNTQGASQEQKRKVELRLEFWQLEEERKNIEELPLEPGTRCPNDLR